MLMQEDNIIVHGKGWYNNVVRQLKHVKHMVPARIDGVTHAIANKEMYDTRLMSCYPSIHSHHLIDDDDNSALYHADFNAIFSFFLCVLCTSV
jgi:hypothetical protein